MKPPLAIYVYVCEKCSAYQRYPGSCESSCNGQTQRIRYVLAPREARLWKPIEQRSKAA